MLNKILSIIFILISNGHTATLDLVPRNVIQHTVQFMEYDTIRDFEKTNKRNRYTCWEYLAKCNDANFQDWIDTGFLNIPVEATTDAQPLKDALLARKIIPFLLMREHSYIPHPTNSQKGTLRICKLPKNGVRIPQSEVIYALLQIPYQHPLLEIMVADGVATGTMGYSQSKKDPLRLAHGGIRRAQLLVLQGMITGMYGFERVNDVQEILNYATLGWEFARRALETIINTTGNGENLS